MTEYDPNKDAHCFVCGCFTMRWERRGNSLTIGSWTVAKPYIYMARLTNNREEDNPPIHICCECFECIAPDDLIRKLMK